MRILVRRSNLLVPVDDARAVAEAWRHGADAVTLDLEGRPAARAAVKDAIAAAGQGAAEVFVRVDTAALRDDLAASIAPGLRGIVLRAESSAELREADAVAGDLEHERGLAAGALSFIVMLGTAKAVWGIREIVAASRRISQVALDEAALAADLGIKPVAEIDPFEYARGRVVVEAIAAKVGPVGIAWPLGAKPREAPPDAVQAFATRARNIGMKGVLCPYASWIAPVNAAFTPTAEQVAWNRRVREAFAAGVAAGTAAVPLDGKMIDVPVDEWAIVVLAMAEACAKRDAEKAAAVGKLGR